jgi:hypothetical protein
MPLDYKHENLVLDTLIRHEKLISQQTEVINDLQKIIQNLIDLMQEDANV